MVVAWEEERGDVGSEGSRGGAWVGEGEWCEYNRQHNDKQAHECHRN